MNRYGYAYDEERVIEEVMYLHSLWHQGPPLPPPPNPNPIRMPEPYIPHQPFYLLRPHHQPPFAPAHTRSLPLPPPPPPTSRQTNRKRKRRRRKDPIPPPDPGPEWPCSVSPDPPETDWAPFKPRSEAVSLSSLSPEEKERLSALQAQNKASRAFRNFLIDSDDDDDDDEEEDDDEGLEEIEEFFVGIFMEDDQMRGYYQRCFENGEFCCLVCGAIGKKKSGKRYKDCVGLVQHSMSISRTVKKLAHRAFGHAVCKVLGWDIDRLPTIVMKGVPLGIKNDKPEGEPKENITDDDVVARGGKVVEHAQGGDQGIGWPSFNTKLSSQTCAVSAEAQASVAVLQMQRKALEACGEYLVGNAGSDCDDDTDDEDEDELTDYPDPVECEEFKFFLKLFTEDSDLRRYYENHYREGDFYCLVCGGLGKKKWKRFKGCVALLQHSTAIKRTKRKQAHRACSQVICKVLGWDIDRLPAIVLKGESLGSSLAGPSKLSGKPEKPADDSDVLQENLAELISIVV